MDGALITFLWYWGSNGEVLTGWLQTGNNWYWLDPANDGVMSRGIVSVGSSRYYLSDSGAMAVGWAFDGTDWYYADGSGALASGWRLVNGVWYWLDVANDNRMATGFLSSDPINIIFFFNGSAVTRLVYERWRLVLR